MKHSILILSILVLVVSSCSSGGVGKTFSPSPVPKTDTPISFPPTPTPISATLSQDATLYNGPGNVNYERLAELPAGTAVYPLGTYGEFVQVSVVLPSGNPANVTGFVWKKYIPSNFLQVPGLDRLQVPWEPFFLSTCSPGKYDPETDRVTFASLSEAEGYFTLSAAWEVSAPIRIQIKALKAQGSIWSGKGSNTEWSNIKIIGSTVIKIRARDDGKYEIDIPTSEKDNYVLFEGRSSSLPIQILFDQPADNRPIGTSLSVLDETGQVLTTVDLTAPSGANLPDGLFPTGKLYFGTETMINSALVVTGLTIGSQPTGQWVEQANILDYLNSPGLSKLAEGRDITIGTDFMLDKAIDRRYCQVMQHDFNVAIVSKFTWQEFWLGEGEYAWGSVDRAVDFAIQHGWRVRASHLVWGAPEAIPDWLINGTYTRDEYITILENHIKAVIGHFKGRVQEWSIANEAIERIACNEPEFYDFWYRKIGSDYIRLAFETAREADPHSILIFNSSTNHSSNFPPPMGCRNPTISRMQSTVMALNAGDTKLVDVVGMQMHLLTHDIESPPRKTDVITIMQGFSQLGVRVYITEMDVDLTFIQNEYPTQEQRWDYQAGLYRDMLAACLESGACDSFATWGISDSMSPIVTSCQGCWNAPSPDADPLMFDDNFHPKPAYFTVRDSLK